MEHCGPNNDDNLNYRNIKYLNNWKKKCPLLIYKKQLKNNKILTNKNFELFTKNIKTEIENAFIFAKKKFPKKIYLKKYIYAK